MTESQTKTYKAALKQARTAFQTASKRLQDLEFETHALAHERAQLRRTITALAALCSEAPGFDSYGITDSCLEVMESQQGVVTTAEVVAALDAMGFDLASQKNASASVHAVLSRLAAKGKIVKVSTESGVTWKGPNFDPNYVPEDDIPF